MRRGGARGGLLWAAALLGMAASAAWAQQTPDRCSVVNLQDAFLEAFSACEASGGSASAGCCKAVEGFTAGSSTGAADCLCYQDTYDSLKDLVKDQGFKTFFIDDIAKGCSADFGVKVGTPKNRCNADQPDADADAGADPGADADQPDGPVEPEAPMTCAGMRKKACRKKSGGNCFFFRKVCRATLQNGADPDDCSLLSRRPKACRRAGCQPAGRRKNRSCSAPPAAASSKP